jgi:acetylornithine deacetylase/succinyl-diaminopimelate desuccinylase-like protein
VTGGLARGWPGLTGELHDFVAHETVSAGPGRGPALRDGARWLARRVQAAGFPDVRLIARGGAPVVVGRWDAGPGLPALLLYGHYDVQPAGDRESWSGPPFRLRTVAGRLVGRGASDDKGFVLAQLEGVRRAASRSPSGAPALNLRCLYEGEEEIGSATLPAVLAAHRGVMRADAAVVCDTESSGQGRPSLTVSCRGEITVDIDVRGPERDLHAGRFGGAVRAPAQVLAEIVASLHDTSGRVRLGRFYHSVRPVAGAVPDDRAVLAAAGVEVGWGEAGFGPGARVGTRPAVVVTRLAAGTTGRGPHHVLPATASGQLNIRIVADQDPQEVYRSVVRHVAHHAAGGGVLARTTLLLAARPWAARTRHPAVRAAVASEGACAGVAPVRVRSGGSIPALAHLEDLGVVRTSAVLGFAQAQDRAHGPDESVDPRRLDLAASTVSDLLERYGALR